MKEVTHLTFEEDYIVYNIEDEVVEVREDRELLFLVREETVYEM